MQNNYKSTDEFPWMLILCAITIFFSGFVVGSSYEQWQSQRLANQCGTDPEFIEAYPDPISGGVQPEILK